MIVRFEGFELDLETEELARGSELLPLPPQPAKILALLVRHAGRTLSRTEIQRHVWGDDHVQSDMGLNSCVRKIRAQLGDDPREPRFIKTLSRRGYRFIAPVQESGPVAQLGAPETAGLPPDPPEGAEAQVRPGVRFAVAGFVGAGAILTILLLLWLAREPGVQPGIAADPVPQEEILVAVLPFKDLSANPEPRSGSSTGRPGCSSGRRSTRPPPRTCCRRRRPSPIARPGG